MLVNKNQDIELSAKESLDLMRILMSPSQDLVNKREQFFSCGDAIQISMLQGNEFIAEIDDLDLSFLEEMQIEQTVNSFECLGKIETKNSIAYSAIRYTIEQEYTFEIEIDTEIELVGEIATKIYETSNTIDGYYFTNIHISKYT